MNLIIFQNAYLSYLKIFNNKYPKINPPMWASHEILLLCTAIKNWEISQNNIKYLAFNVVGKNTPNGTNTNNLALGKRYKYAPINAETIPEEPTIGLIL